VYYPLFPIWLWFAIQERSLFFFSAANPAMAYGGLTMESKMEIYQMIPKAVIPKTILLSIAGERDWGLIQEQIRTNELHFPCIAKPDVGLKGLGVTKIHNFEELQAYCQKVPKEILVQELVEYPNEVGLFYVRLPGEEKGRITGIVKKEFLHVVGDGESSLQQLIFDQPRCLLQWPSLKEELREQELEEVLEAGEKKILLKVGSHTRGALFLDYSDRITPVLENWINEVCKQVQGFYYGRLDIMYDNWDAFERGEDYRIIEINGAGSEPTHIYDPKHSLWFAWKEIKRHGSYMHKIARRNHRRGIPYLSRKEGRQMLREHRELESFLESL
jgi:hypothetical protein